VLGQRCKNRGQAGPLLEAALADGSALAVFRRMVKAQGGDARVVDDPSRLPRSKVQHVITAERAGYVSAIDAYALGVLAIELGAGRTRAEQKIDLAAGFELHSVVGDRVTRGASLVTVHAATKALAKQVEARVLRAFRLAASAPKRRQLVLERLR